MKTDSQQTAGKKGISWRSLVRKNEFQKVYERGAKRVGSLVVVYVLAPEVEQNTGTGPDFARAVVASKKVGNAVARNRAKRLLREARRLGFLGNLRDPADSGDPTDFNRLKRVCERLLWEPSGHGASGETAGGSPAVDPAVAAEETNSFAGLWVVLVARRRILSASSREVREELDSLLKSEPQLQ